MSYHLEIGIIWLLFYWIPSISFLAIALARALSLASKRCVDVGLFFLISDQISLFLPLSSPFFFLIRFFWVTPAGTLCIQAGLKLKGSSCFCFPNSGIRGGVQHHCPDVVFLYGDMGCGFIIHSLYFLYAEVFLQFSLFWDISSHFEIALLVLSA